MTFSTSRISGNATVQNAGAHIINGNHIVHRMASIDENPKIKQNVLSPAACVINAILPPPIPRKNDHEMGISCRLGSFPELQRCTEGAPIEDRVLVPQWIRVLEAEGTVRHVALAIWR